MGKRELRRKKNYAMETAVIEISDSEEEEDYRKRGLFTFCQENIKN
jgi:hypothetical protein